MHTALAIISQEHRSMATVIDALEYLARDVADGREPDYDVLTVILDYIETFPNWLHHPKEDRYLFRTLRVRIAEFTGLDASVAATRLLDELESEHQRGNELLRELRYLLTRCRIGGPDAREGFAAAVERFVAFQRVHMRKEEEVVHPMALETLTDDDWTAIDAAFIATDDSVFSAAPRREFDALFRLIIAMTSRPVRTGRSATEGRQE